MFFGILYHVEHFLKNLLIQWYPTSEVAQNYVTSFWKYCPKILTFFVLKNQQTKANKFWWFYFSLLSSCDIDPGSGARRYLSNEILWSSLKVYKKKERLSGFKLANPMLDNIPGMTCRLGNKLSPTPYVQKSKQAWLKSIQQRVSEPAWHEKEKTQRVA